MARLHGQRRRARQPQFPVGAAGHHGKAVAGALNIYAREPDAFDEDSRSAATRSRPMPPSPPGTCTSTRAPATRLTNLRDALESRAVIDQAKGILMERHKLTADQAFQMLAQVSMQTNVKVHAIAEHLVRTGEFHGR